MYYCGRSRRGYCLLFLWVVTEVVVQSCVFSGPSSSSVWVWCQVTSYWGRRRVHVVQLGGVIG